MKFNLERLKKSSLFMKHVRWDVYPETIFKPRFVTNETKKRLMGEIQGFMFYIDYMGGDHAGLMLMKTYNLTSKTLGEVPDVPSDILLNAVKRQGVKSIVGMFPIDDAVEGWLKKELGITP